MSGELEQERENEEGINQQITAVDNWGSPLLRPSERDHMNLGGGVNCTHISSSCLSQPLSCGNLSK